MPIELKMPALSPTMEKGTLSSWLVGVGDAVAAGDLIAEIETNKATMEFEAIDDGHIQEIIVPAGTEDVAVGTVIALIGQDGETSAWEEKAPKPGEDKAEEPAPIAYEAANIPPPQNEPRQAARSAEPVLLDETAKATPLAKRIAAIEHIDLTTISGSGPGGKIVKSDLIPDLSAPAPSPRPGPQTFELAYAPPPAGVPVQSVKLSPMRKTIARRLTESKTQIPHFYLTVRCNLDPLLVLRAELNASLEAQGIKLSVNDLLIKAMAKALTRVPDANVQFGGDVLHRFERVDISMAVAIEGGLVTPVIRDAGSMSVSAIAQTSKDLATRARDGKLAPEDYQGGTSSLSNLGMFGIHEMLPVINPPQAMILGIGAAIRQPWEVDGELGLATVMAATASFDHRAIDGAAGAEFMSAFKSLVEKPMSTLT